MRKIFSLLSSLGWLASSKPKNIRVDPRSRVISSTLEGYNVLYGRVVVKNTHIGRGTYIAFGTHINQSEIGRFCSIGQQCRIGGLGRHPTTLFTAHPAFYSTAKQAGFTFVQRDLYQEYLPTVVGNNCWIGYGVVVLDGVTIGDNAVIAAGSVVTKNVPANSIMGGIPARLIRTRDDEVCADAWWDLPFEELRRRVRSAEDLDFNQYTINFERARWDE